METRRFDELTVAIARGGSRRGVLRGLVGGVLGAVALDRSGALAKNDKNPEIEAKPFCPDGKDDTAACPLCYEAALQCCNGDPTDARACALASPDGCAESNKACGLDASGNVDSCVTATCKEQSGNRWRCEYTAHHGDCTESGKGFCCRVYESSHFGKCVTNKSQCVNG